MSQWWGGGCLQFSSCISLSPTNKLNQLFLFAAQITGRCIPLDSWLPGSFRLKVLYIPSFPNPSTSPYFESQAATPTQGLCSGGEKDELAGFPSEPQPPQEGPSWSLGEAMAMGGSTLTAAPGLTAQCTAPFPYFKLSSWLKKQDTLWKLSFYLIRSGL